MPTSHRSPIFLLGNPRSGTTLLRLMLTCHRDIVIPPECGFAVWLYPRYRSWNAANAEELIPRFAADVLECRKIETWEIREKDLRALLLEARPTSYAEAAELVYVCYARTRGRTFRRWGDKNNFYIEHLETVHEIFPGAFYLHLIRDVRNVACSYKWLHERRIEAPYAPRLPWESGAIARQWTENNERIGAFLELHATGRCHVLRFEDLVADAEGELRRLCGALGEDFDPGMLDYARRNRRESLEPKELLAWKSKTLQPLMPTEIDRYTRELDGGEIAAIEAVAGETLRRYGFVV